MIVSFTWKFDIIADGTASVPAEVDSIMECLLAIENASVSNSGIGLDLERMSIEIGLTVTSSTIEEAVASGMTAIRSAIHAAGGSTASWPTSDEFQMAGLRFTHSEVIAA